MPALHPIEVRETTRADGAGVASSKSVSGVESDSKPKTKSQLLPIQLSESAPRHANIVSRNQDDNGIYGYKIKIGNTFLEDIAVEEVLDYVSAYELEEFENKQFDEERQVLDALEDERRREEEERRRRASERARSKGVARIDSVSVSVSDGDENNVSEGARSGRARPSYKKMFLQRRRRRRDPLTGDLVPSGSEGQMDEPDFSSEGNANNSAPPERGQAPVSPLKRRRRKRDPVTGDLMPLELPAAKRRRRKRHPLTGELMPLGWRYNQEQHNHAVAKQQRNVAGPAMPALKGLSLSQGHVQGGRASGLGSVPVFNHEELEDDDSDSEDDLVVATRPQAMRRSVGGASLPVSSQKTKPAVIVIADTPSEDEQPKTSILKPSAVPPTMIPATRETLPRTSIMQPSAAAQLASLAQQDSDSSIDITAARPSQQRKPTTAQPDDDGHIDLDDDEDESDEDLDDGEFVIETILSHHLSDPRTHPPALGTQPVLLYQVKWEGWAKPTWEPRSSFVDDDVVKDYERRVGLI